MRVYNTALEQTRDNVKACEKQTPISYNQYQVIAKIERQILAVLNNLFYYQIQNTVSILRILFLIKSSGVN